VNASIYYIFTQFFTMILVCRKYTVIKKPLIMLSAVFSLHNNLYVSGILNGPLTDFVHI